jgi:hypothetical protein
MPASYPARAVRFQAASDRRLVVHRVPNSFGYAEIRVLLPHARLAPLAFADAILDVAAMTGR